MIAPERIRSHPEVILRVAFDVTGAKIDMLLCFCW